jgi:hypothetical protein
MRARDDRPRGVMSSVPAAALLAGVWTLVCLATLLIAPGAGAAEGCPNEARRLEQGEAALALPDCRAYEMVSPPRVTPYTDGTTGFEASLGGDRMSYFDDTPQAPESQFGIFYLSTRGADGWSSRDMIPPQSVANEKWCFPSLVYSPDLSKSVLQDGWRWGEGYPTYPDEKYENECGHDAPLLVSGEPLGAQNLFLHDNETPAQAGFYQLLNLTPSNLAARSAYFQAGSSDFTHILFTSAARLTGEAPAVPAVIQNGGRRVGEDLYETAGGVVRLVSILPGGEAVWGLPANGTESQSGLSSAVFTHGLSVDGERAFFYAGGEFGPNVGEPYHGGSLYLRENAGQARTEECSTPVRACTVQIDVAQGGPESGGGVFQWATPDGSKAFFTDDRKLTADSTAQAGKPDLYEYDLLRPLGARLADLTVHASEPADVLGVSGISEDGSRVYFVAMGLLSGEQTNSHGDEAQLGKANLYLRHAGATTFVAALEPPPTEEVETIPETKGDPCDWDSATNPVSMEIQRNCMSARVSPDGSFLAFNSQASLTGYDNTVVEPAEPGERDNEIFLYEAAGNQLSCASCDPANTPPTAEVNDGDPSIPTPMTGQNAKSETPGYLTRSLSDDGAVFFDTRNRLLPADVNGPKFDVYEYAGGSLRLISTGASPDNARFRDASASGDDVFFNTTQALVGRDSDNGVSLYDAHVGGGFAEPPAAPSPCESLEGEGACRVLLSPPQPSTSSGSAGFVGPSNPSPPPPPPPPPPSKRHCKKGFKRVKRHGHVVCRRVHSHHNRRGASRGPSREGHR